jgi:hypothetical protein
MKPFLHSKIHVKKYGGIPIVIVAKYLLDKSLI